MEINIENNKKIVLGIVESIDDETYSGRIKVRVPGYHDNMTTEQLPWCYYGGSSINSGNGGGSISIARVGQQVRVRFTMSEDEPTSMEWYAVNALDPALINEIKSDYKDSQILLYDSSYDVSIKWQPTSGMTIYYAGSFIQISPDNTITIHYGKGASGTQIQLSDGRVDVQASKEINLSVPNGRINLEADNIVLNGNNSVQFKGDTANECAINGTQLMTALLTLASAVDLKAPQTNGVVTQRINSFKEGILNQKIQYI